jgi:hypothetical protein
LLIKLTDKENINTGPLAKTKLQPVG